MDRRDYTDRVLSSLRRVTEKEREAIRSELDGHIEDHMEALRELGHLKGKVGTTITRSWQKSGPSPPWESQMRWDGS